MGKADKVINKVINYLNAIMALAKQSNNENTDAIVMLALEAEGALFNLEEDE